jgi:hypothetical protein
VRVFLCNCPGLVIVAFAMSDLPGGLRVSGRKRRGMFRLLLFYFCCCCRVVLILLVFVVVRVEGGYAEP